MTRVVTWLLTDALDSGSLAEFVAGFGEALRANGVPVDRVWIGLILDHPLQANEDVTWTPETGSIVKGVPAHALAAVREGVLAAKPLLDEHGIHTLRLADVPHGVHGLPRHLWDDGYVQLATFGIRRSLGVTSLCTLATRAEQGFSDAQLQLLETTRLPLVAAVRIHDLSSRLHTLAATYLGRDVGARVIAGAIHRGDGETIRAAIWFSDLRGFTGLSERLSQADLLELLDAAFEVQVAQIHRHGGEVLKLMGDGLMAIFRPSELRSEEQACAAALDAAEAVERELLTLNRSRVDAGRDPIRHGVGVHFGDVLYGNIGSPDRLDFTVIGPAVNLAARLESQCGGLDETLVASEEVARRCPDRLHHVADRELKGVRDAVRVYARPKPPR